MRIFFSRRFEGGAAALAAAIAIAIASGMLASGCANSAGSNQDTTPAYSTFLYMTDTSNGHVCTYDPSTHTVSSSSLLTTKAGNAAGEIQFYKGIGYVAMGYGGVYYFDPSATAPSATLLTGSGSLDAEYFAFYSAKKAYVSVSGSYGSDTGGVYTFNPSSPSSGLTQVDAGNAGKYMQEIIVGPDNYVYVAEELSQKVLRIDPSSNTVVATIPASQSRTTGLCSGTYDGGSGVFVANLGGSIDFIPSASSASSTTVKTVLATSTSASIYPARLAQLSNRNLVATGYDTSYVSRTYLVNLAGTTATVSEIKGTNGESFGSFSIAYDSSSGLVYVPYVATWGLSSKLYVFDTSGSQQSYSPVSVMSGTN